MFFFVISSNLQVNSMQNSCIAMPVSETVSLRALFLGLRGLKTQN